MLASSIALVAAPSAAETTVVDDPSIHGPAGPARRTGIGWDGDMWTTGAEGAGRPAVNSAEWVGNISGGTYNVEVFIPRSFATARVNYYVRWNGGQQVVTVDQNAHYDAWVSLGSYAINGPQASIGSNDVADPRGAYVGWDAVRWTKAGSQAIAVGQGAGNQSAYVSAFNAVGGAPVIGQPVNAVHGWGPGCIQDFAGGREGKSAIMSRGCSGNAYVLSGAFWAYFEGRFGGRAAEELGYPYNFGHRYGPGWTQDFDGGRFGWNLLMHGDRVGRVHLLFGGIRDKYVSLGGADGFLGYPTSDEHDWNNEKRQNFEGGAIVWNASAGARYLGADPNLGDGGLNREASSPGVYVIFGGAKFGIPSPQEFEALGYRWENIRIVSDGSLGRVSDVPRDGTLLKERSDPAIYVMEAGRKRHIDSPQTFEARGYRWENVRVVPNGGLSRFSNGPTVSGGGSPQPTAVSYIALGDSYSSGEGTYNYDADGRSCHRGPAAWPRILDVDHRNVGLVSHVACTGAVTRDLRQASKKAGSTQIPTVPLPATGLVTLTIGGNDVGFASVMTECYVGPCGYLRKDQRLHAKFERLENVLVEQVYPALRQAFPNARIVHVGYPRITPPAGTATTGCGWLEPNEQETADYLGTLLNNTIRRAAERYGQVEFISVADALKGNELCTEDSWVDPVVGEIMHSEQGHPNFNGQVAYAKAVAQALGLP